MRLIFHRFWWLILSLLLVACEPKAPLASPTQLEPQGTNLADSGATAIPSIPAEQAVPLVAAEDKSMTPEPASPNEAVTVVQTFPDPNAYRWVEVASRLKAPVGMGVAGDGLGRLFILE